MKTRYLVTFIEYSIKFNETKLCTIGTFDLEKFCKTHHVVEAWTCKLAPKNSGYRYIKLERII